MRIQTLFTLSVLGVACASAQNLAPVSKAAAASLAAGQAAAAVYNGPRTNAAMWIWSDKYVYQAGQSLTLKWTVKPNGDL